MTKLWAFWFAMGLMSACAGKPTHTPDVREITHRALERGRRHAGAVSAFAAVIDARSGRLLAIASSDPANRQPAQALVQQAVPAGLLATPILVAGAIKMGRGRLDLRYDTENGRYALRDIEFVDRSPFGEISAEEIIVNASTIGAVKIGESLGVNLYNGLAAYGISTKHLPSSDAVLDDQDAFAQLAAGYTLKATPLELLEAYRQLAKDRPMRGALKRAVKEGTGKLANSAIYPTAGMSGTGGRAGQTASFIGFSPVEEARIVVYVRVEKPQGTILPGMHAAPIFKEIVEGSLPLIP